MRSLTMLGALGVSMALATTAPSQEPKAEWKGGSRIQGATIYKHYCRVCHGDAGRGDGVIAADLRVAPTDLTLLSSANAGAFPTVELVRIIDGRKRAAGHGTSDMPAWGDVFTRKEEDEQTVKQRVTDLVEYLRSIQRNEG